ncbi:MAG: hypothetical protein AAB784_03145 [Patescibacteria group bacterium]
MFSSKFLDSRFKPLRKKPPATFTEQLNACDRARFSQIHSNTTVFALIYKGGVLVAGDRRTSGGYLEIVSDETTKVRRVTDHSVIAAAGFCNVISDLEDSLSSVCNKFRSLYERDLSPDGQANFLRQLLESWWFFSMYSWYWVVGIPILAAFDIKENRPRIFAFDESGYYYEPKFFGGTGCGFETIKGLVHDLWKPDMTEGMAILIAMKAMLQSGALSSGVSDTRLYLPTIGIIDKNGFRLISDKVLKVVKDTLVKQTESLK